MRKKLNTQVRLILCLALRVFLNITSELYWRLIYTNPALGRPSEKNTGSIRNKAKEHSLVAKTPQLVSWHRNAALQTVWIPVCQWSPTQAYPHIRPILISQSGNLAVRRRVELCLDTSTDNAPQWENNTQQMHCPTNVADCSPTALLVSYKRSGGTRWLERYHFAWVLPVTELPDGSSQIRLAIQPSANAMCQWNDDDQTKATAKKYVQ